MERENREFASPREGGPPAESLPGRCPLVRPGAAPERGTGLPPLSGVKCVWNDTNAGGTAEGLPFVPELGTEGFFVWYFAKGKEGSVSDVKSDFRCSCNNDSRLLRHPLGPCLRHTDPGAGQRGRCGRDGRLSSLRQPQKILIYAVKHTESVPDPSN